MIIANLCSLSDQIVMETIQANPVSGNDAMDQSSDSTLVEPQTNSKTPRRIEEKEYLCTQCHESFKSAKLLREHFLSHTTSLEMPFKCSTCGEGFCDLLSKRKHLSKHRVERKFKCNGCVRSFYQMSALEKHSCRGFGRLNQTTKEHDDAPRPFKCNQCNKTFARKDTLSNHLPIHSKVKQFRCDLCQRQYTQRTALIRHKRVHNDRQHTQGETSSDKKRIQRSKDDQGYRCQICGKCLSTLGALDLHQRIHTAEKPHRCKKCGRCFTQSSTLIGHLRTHDDYQKKPYK